MTGPYTFRPLAEAYLPTMAIFLAEPHVRAWWGDPDGEIATMREILAGTDTEAFVVAVDGEDIGYIQAWQIEAVGAYPDQPAGTRAIDCFIGPPSMLGHGHGARFVAAFSDALLARGVPRVITDPAPQNTHGIAMYTRAGFRRLGPRDTQDGPVVLMARDPGPTEHQT